MEKIDLFFGYKIYDFLIIIYSYNQASVSDTAEKSQPSEQRLMPESSFSTFFVYPRVWISQSPSKTGDRFYLSLPFQISRRRGGVLVLSSLSYNPARLLGHHKRLYNNTFPLPNVVFAPFLLSTFPIFPCTMLCRIAESNRLC